MSNHVTFNLNGTMVTAQPGETIRECATRLGIEIPGMCSGLNPHYPNDGSCRLCMVEIAGERTLSASCKRTPTEGMEVSTTSERSETTRKMVMELLLSDRPIYEPSTYTPANRFYELSEAMGVESTRFTPRPDNEAPDSS
ncbi:MAG: 2Fe-2S iron-sulfur cluster-binding protein, partial [Magnetovibrio sp.]|nr:2Fe-2S iron-sulfur cluster-binding protein [Magnetovibrio sp.]